MKQPLNPDTAQFAKLAAELQEEYLDPAESEWAESPFLWIVTRRSSRQRGKIGEQLAAAWCTAHGLSVSRSPDSDADRVIEGKRVEIKFSTRWVGGAYVFQQIRDQEYDYILCIGISPFAVHAWCMKKSEIPFDALKHQHGGDRGRDTWWFSVNPENPPAWLAPFGGTLTEVLEVLRGG